MAAYVPTTPDLFPTCAACSKAESELPSPLKRCGRCRSTSYCSRECQKADWKVHKKSGGKEPDFSHKSFQQTGEFMARNFFPALSDYTYLSSFSEKDAFDQLIDSYRLRVEDDCNFRGEFSGLYNQENPLPHFRRYLDLAEAQPGLLPKWWSKEKRAACERLAVDSGHWSDLHSAVEKDDIQEHYKDNLMPIKMRILAEKIYGRGLF